MTISLFCGLPMVLVLIGGVLVAAPAEAGKTSDFLAAQMKGCEEGMKQLQALISEPAREGTNSSAGPRVTQEHHDQGTAALQRMQSLFQEYKDHPPTTPEQESAFADRFSAEKNVSKFVVHSFNVDLGREPLTVLDSVGRQLNSPVEKSGPGIPSTIGPKLETMGQNVPDPAKEINRLITDYKSSPGGVVLEGTADLGGNLHVHYDHLYDGNHLANVMVIDNRAVFFLGDIPPPTIALLCRAIANDYDDDLKRPIARVGVSLGHVLISYGKVPLTSDLAQDLMLTDEFLGEIVFAHNDRWLRGYKFKDGFVPETSADDKSDIVVSFVFAATRFVTEQNIVRATVDTFAQPLVYPISKERADDGGGKPDYAAISAGARYPEFEHNATHIRDNISYYRRERIIDRTFTYTEIAAFIRGLKAAHVDLENLAQEVERLN